MPLVKAYAFGIRPAPNSHYADFMVEYSQRLLFERVDTADAGKSSGLVSQLGITLPHGSLNRTIPYTSVSPKTCD